MRPRVFRRPEPLFDVFIDYQAFEPFTGADLPTREQVQLVYETCRSRLYVPQLDASNSGVFTSNTNRPIVSIRTSCFRSMPCIDRRTQEAVEKQIRALGIGFSEQVIDVCEHRIRPLVSHRDRKRFSLMDQ